MILIIRALEVCFVGVQGPVRACVGSSERGTTAQDLQYYSQLSSFVFYFKVLEQKINSNI